MTDNRFISDSYPGLPNPKGNNGKTKGNKEDVSFNMIDKDSSYIANKHNKKNNSNIYGMVVVWQENF